MNSEIKRRARRYGVLKEISKITEDDPTRPSLSSAFSFDGEDEYISGARKTVTVDQSWLTKCEEALPHIREAIEQCRSLLKKDGEVVRIDRAKRPSKDSVTHLARHSNLIKSIKDDGMPEPEEIYITENDEEYAVYENRFLYMALSYMHSFISVRYEKMARIASEAGVSLRINRNSRKDNRSISYKLEMSETSNDTDSASDLLHQQTMAKIRGIMNAVSGYLSSPLMKSISSAPKLHPPVVRTNIIKNNVHFAAVYELYTFLSSYTGEGYTVKNDAKSERKIPGRLSEALCDIAALQYFLLYQGAFDGWDDSESAYDEDEAEKRGEELRRLKLDVDAARESCMAGKKTKEEYIELLEKSNAGLTSGYEAAGIEVSDLRKKNREQRREIIRLSAEFDMISDKMKKAAEESDQRIRENAIKTEKLYLEKANSAVFAAKAEFEAKKAEYDRENDLLRARLRSYALMNGEGGEIGDREEFIRLEREHKALDDYYKDQWAKAKRRIRKREFRNRKSGGEGEE